MGLCFAMWDNLMKIERCYIPKNHGIPTLKLDKIVLIRNRLIGIESRCVLGIQIDLVMFLGFDDEN